MDTTTNIENIYKEAKLPGKIHSLITTLTSQFGIAREEARHKLAKVGNPAVAYIAELMESPDDHIRWEATITLTEIADPVTIPLFIKALEDDIGGIRCLAAESLTRFGTDVIKALLSELVIRPGSVLFFHGVHHIIHDLRGFLKDEHFDNLLNALKRLDSENDAKYYANKILQKLE